MARLPARPLEQRIADTLEQLRRLEDCWVASADAEGNATLALFSFHWDGTSLVLAMPETAVTARNLLRAGRVRLGLGPTRDVVLVEGTVDADVDEASKNAHAAALRWDPREEPKPYVYLRVTPQRIQAWREANELAGRTIMRDGAWLA